MSSHQSSSHQSSSRAPVNKYEEAKVLSVRATQLARGAEPKIQVKPGMSNLQIADLELTMGVIPVRVAVVDTENAGQPPQES